ncbi:MAG: FxsA family protein [Planctomycetota bacterium]|jgi:UPF0716 protein FxsA
MLIYLILAFTLIPVFEIYLLINIGSIIGAPMTIVVILATGIAGGWLVRRQGLLTITLIKKDFSEGKVPADRIISGLFIIIGGVLMITPGFFTDVIGFLLMIPGNRRFLAKQMKQKLSDGNFQNSGSSFFFHNFSSNHNQDNEL